MSKTFPITKTGAWVFGDKDIHAYDEPLCKAIIALLKEDGCKTVADLGCGQGQYVSAMNGAGIDAVGYDGNPHTPQFAPKCQVHDLSTPLRMTQVDWVVSLEVGEHIPQEFENQFLENICYNAKQGVILSWFPDKGHGIGHVNEQSNAYVIKRMEERGFSHNDILRDHLRNSAVSWWFKVSLMVFFRKPETGYNNQPA